MPLREAAADDFSPSRNKSSEETIKISANGEESCKIEQMEVESESQDKYQCFLRWLRSSDDCPEIRVLKGFILHHAEICDVPFLDEKSINDFINGFDFAGSKRGGKSVVQTLMEQCEIKMEMLSAKSEATDSDGQEVTGEEPDPNIEDLWKSALQTLGKQREDKMEMLRAKSEETADSNGRDLVGDKEDQECFEERAMKSWLNIWMKNFNAYMEHTVTYVDTNLDLIEFSKIMEFDQDWLQMRANELDLFLEKLRVMKHRTKSVKKTLGSAERYT